MLLPTSDSEAGARITDVGAVETLSPQERLERAPEPRE
jgi:hypothetical protein